MTPMQATNALIPPLVSSEALRSYVERMRLLNSAHSGAFTLSPVRVNWSAPDWSLPTGLKGFANTYGEVIKLPSAWYWVNRHTLAPYYQTTLDPYRSRGFIQRLLEPAHGPRRPLLAIALTEWFAKQPVLCAACDEEAVDQLGFSYVQRHWLLPFLTRCHIHGEVLAEHSTWSPSGRGRPTKIPVLSRRAAAGRLLTNASLAMLEQESRQLEELGQLLQSRDFITRAGHLRRKRLCQLLLTHAKGRYEHPELNLLLSSEATVAKLLAPLGSKRACLHPVVAHVLACALRDELEIEQIPLLLFGRQRKFDDLRAAFEVSATATQAAMEAGVSVTTAVIYARAAGYALPERPKVLTEPLRHFILKLIADGEDLGWIATKTGVSLVSVYRVLASNPAIRTYRQSIQRATVLDARQKVWLDLIRTKPGATATQLRRIEPAVYAYLYRWSRDWLFGATPKTGRKQQDHVRTARAPAGADFALAKRLLNAAQFGAKDRGTRRTRTSLMEAAGRPNDVPVESSSAALVLKAETESLQSFVFRRLSAAVVQLQSQGVMPVPWKVERKAGLRSSVIAKSGIRTEMVIANTRAAALRRM